MIYSLATVRPIRTCNYKS